MSRTEENKLNKSVASNFSDEVCPDAVEDILCSIRGIFDAWVSNAPVARDMFAMHSSGQRAIIPCEVVELRGILNTMSASMNDEFVLMFGPAFAEKYLKRSSIFLEVSPKRLNVDMEHQGQLFVVKDGQLDLSFALNAVIVNQPASQNIRKVVERILRQSGEQVELRVSNSVPGISSPHPLLASDKNMVKNAQKLEIQLTPPEAQLFNTLKAKRDEAGLSGQVEMRVAGGWVRDKLLGLPSDDIDISLSNMTGGAFVAALGIGGATIAANPERSKHLETVKAQVGEFEVDFVNLRSEEYTDSRVPEMQMGTPEQDAARRDLTINSMFFNIETGQVEDYVNGQADLANMHLRTPLDPKQTFMDDPLRVMRVLRFHSRYPGSTVDDSIVEAMGDPEVQHAYSGKVAMERAGKEMMKLMEGENPAEALRILFESDFYKSAFSVPEMEGLHPIQMDQQNPHHKLDLMNHTLEVVHNLNKMMVDQGEDKEMRGLMNLAAVFHDFGKMHPDIRQPKADNPEHMTYSKHELESADIADSILKAIGVGSDKRKIVRKVVEMHMRPHTEEWSGKAMGKFLRDTQIPGNDRDDLWKYIMYHSMADTMSKGTDDYHDDLALKQQHMQGFEDYIEQRAQQPTSAAKPLLNGNEVMQAVNSNPDQFYADPKTGFIREVNDMLLDAADAGEISTPEQARAKVEQWKMMNVERFGKGTQAMNWFKRTKTADGSGGGGGGNDSDYEMHPYEGGDNIFEKPDEEVRYTNDVFKDTPLQDWKEDIAKVKRYQTKNVEKGPFIERTEGGGAKKNDVVAPPLGEGDRVIDRTRGVAMPQRFGVVAIMDVDNGELHIEWEDSPEPQIINMNDTVGLAKLIGKA